MVRFTKTIDLQDELDRINNELTDVAEEAAQYDPDSPARERLDSEGKRLERYLAGVAWAVNPPEDDDARSEGWRELTVGDLSAGEYADLRDVTSQSKPGEGTAGTGTVMYASKGTVDAPFLDDSMSEAEQISAVASLKPQFQLWLANKIDTLSEPDIPGNGYAARVAENRETEN